MLMLYERLYGVLESERPARVLGVVAHRMCR
jgi:hypothetical protein